MKSIFDSIAHWLLVVAVLLVLLLSWGVDHYRSKARAATTDLQQLQADVRAQNTTAKTTLERLTGERDTAQTALNQLRKQQEKNDVTSTNEIARLSDELKHRPVRVRIVTAAVSGASGGCTPGDAATSNTAGAADTGTAYGLLPAANSARLGAVITEVETINAAYASCRAQLLQP